MYKKVVNINGVNTNNLKVLTHEEMISLFKKYKEGIELVKKCSLMIDKVEKEMIIINDDKDSEMIDDD